MEIETINFDPEHSDEEIDYEQLEAQKYEHECQFCDKKFRISKMLFQHQTMDHKDQKISLLLGNLIETEVFYSSDSDCDYSISVEVIKTQKPKTTFLADDLEDTQNTVKIVEKDHNFDTMKTEDFQDDVDGDRISCCYCTQTFTTQKIHKQHVKLFHIQENGTVEIDLSTMTTFSCPECLRELKDARCLKKHMKLCHNLIIRSTRRRPPPIRVPAREPSVVKGQLCDEFPIIRDRSPTSGKPRTKCGICGHGPVYGYTTIMKHQIRKHGRPKKKTNDVFICDFCTKEFKCKENLSKHLKIHENARRYECDLCDARFNTALLLSRHRRLHVYIKCEICEQEFQFRSQYKSHHRAAHPKTHKNATMMQQGENNEIIVMNEVPKIREGNFFQECLACKKTFRSRRGYKEHQCKDIDYTMVSADDSQDLQFDEDGEAILIESSILTKRAADDPCGVCFKSFKSKKGFANHKCKEQRHVVCPLGGCGLKFGNLRGYYEHVEQLHSGNNENIKPLLIYSMDDETMQLHEVGEVESEIIISN